MYTKYEAQELLKIYNQFSEQLQEEARNTKNRNFIKMVLILKEGLISISSGKNYINYGEARGTGDRGFKSNPQEAIIEVVNLITNNYFFQPSMGLAPEFSNFIKVLEKQKKSAYVMKDPDGDNYVTNFSYLSNGNYLIEGYTNSGEYRNITVDSNGNAKDNRGLPPKGTVCKQMFDQKDAILNHFNKIHRQRPPAVLPPAKTSSDLSQKALIDSTSVELAAIFPTVTPTIQIKPVAAFKHGAGTVDKLVKPEEIILNCEKHILFAFQKLLTGTKILGANYTNPYTQEVQTFPADPTQLTARHLQILARNEQYNVTGKMNTSLYNNLLTDDQIATLRCLVKATTVSGVTYARQMGGYPNKAPITPFKEPQKIIVIDQSGLQWQNDMRNTGGLFFYFDDPHTVGSTYSKWQKQTHLDMYGLPRSDHPSDNAVTVKWLGINGKLDLKGVALGIENEFLQALDAAAAAANTLEAGERVNFKFLKAGMGFFADGLQFHNQDKLKLEHARLQGIEQALIKIHNLPALEQQKALNKIARIELPFSGGSVHKDVLMRIENIVKSLGIQWGGTPFEDAFYPRLGYINAVTNCGDPHAMIGNEGGYQSVDATLSSNAYLNAHNPAFNEDMKIRSVDTINAIDFDIVNKLDVKLKSNIADIKLNLIEFQKEQKLTDFKLIEVVQNFVHRPEIVNNEKLVSLLHQAVPRVIGLDPKIYCAQVNIDPEIHFPPVKTNKTTEFKQKMNDSKTDDKHGFMHSEPTFTLKNL